MVRGAAWIGGAQSNKFAKHKKDEKQISKASAHKFKQQRVR